MALLDVLRAGKTLLEDDEWGINATLAEVNAAKGTAAPPFAHIDALKSPLPTHIPAFPAFFQLPVPGSRLDLKQQKKRQPLWRLEWHALWRWTEQDYEIVAASVEAMILVLERFEAFDNDVRQIIEATLDTTGYVERERSWTIVQLAFGARECEELP